MLISKTVMVRWNGYTKKHYEEKGYVWTKQNDYFECKIEDVMPSSTVRVEVRCDYCEDAVTFKEYRNYLKEREIISKDCCKNRKCMVVKSEEVNLKIHGVKNINKLESNKEKLRKIFQTPKEQVLQVAKSKGLKILNIDDYENDRTRLLVICENHSEEGIQETNFANIKKNKHCCLFIRPEITSKSKKLDGQKVYDEFINKGLIPLFAPNEYKGNSDPLPYKCPNHLDRGIQYRSYSNLPHCNGCEYCSRDRTSNALRNNEEDVFSYFESRGLIVLENQKYKNGDSHIFYRCKKHPENVQSVTYSSLKRTQVPCEYCRFENNISSLNRRMRNCIGEWKQNSEIISNYKCVLTGSDDYDVHHLYSFNSIVKDALLELNMPIKEEYTAIEYKNIKEKVIHLHKKYIGVCIRPDLHILFHQMYGKHNNTPEQFEEFKSKFNNGELNEYEEVS